MTGPLQQDYLINVFGICKISAKCKQQNKTISETVTASSSEKVVLMRILIRKQPLKGAV